MRRETAQQQIDGMALEADVSSAQSVEAALQQTIDGVGRTEGCGEPRRDCPGLADCRPRRAA